MGGTVSYRQNEMMVVAASRLLRDGETVLVGLGLPQLACLLAKARHAPSLRMILEIGVLEPEPQDPAIGIADPRLWYRATAHTSFTETLGVLLHGGRVDVGFLAGAQVDRFGNINSTHVCENGRPVRRFRGSGGACDVAALAKRVIVITPHERRRFPPRVDHLTSPGFLQGGRTRESAGLAGGPSHVITDLAVMAFDPDTREMVLVSVHPGVDAEAVRAATGFPLPWMDGERVTDPPTEEELEILRTRLDPHGWYLR